MRLETDVTINRPVDEVLSFIADISSFASWSENTVEAVQTSEGTLGVGTTCRVISRAMGRSITHEFRALPHERDLYRRAGP